MKYLIWSLINTGLILYFFVICYRAIKLIKEKYGLLTSLFLVIGLLSFASQSSDVNNQVNISASQRKIWTFYSDTIIEPNSVTIKNCEVEKSLSFRLILNVTYGLDKRTKQNIPINASSFPTGFIAGFKWVPTVISVETNENNRGLNCAVTGILEWKLLGLTIYSQSKALSGLIEIK
jgi:hypothetical protein